jgi:hypothetical protein
VPDSPKRHPLDGVRPRNAVCTSCGYHIGGVPIEDGQLICPECGKPVVFVLLPPERHGPSVLARVVVWGTLLMAAIGVGMEYGFKSAVLLGGGVGVVWVLLRGLRRWSAVDS